MINRHTILKRAISVVGVIVLGALGSGLWETVIKPSFGSMRALLLNVASIGMKALKDQTYRDISRGFTEATAVELLSEYTYLYILATVAACLYVLSTSAKIRKGKQELLAKTEVLLGKGEGAKLSDPRKEIEQLREQLIQLPERKLSIFVWVFVLISIYGASKQTVKFAQYSYRNEAISYYKQATILARPHVTEDEMYAIDAQFANIKGKDDYEMILKRLYSILDKNGVDHVVFVPW